MQYSQRFALVLALVGALLLSVSACATKPEAKRPGDPQALQYNLNNFHLDLRWGRWEQAALYVADGYRQSFLGRYEELGDDFKIVDLNIKSITIEVEMAEVDVEQESYKMPSMVVATVRYIEVWKTVGDSWQLFERTERDEYRKAKQEKAKQDAAVKEAAVKEAALQESLEKESADEETTRP
ncbi:MAG: hypothetical protein H0U74_12465 [Bradymonadaceae bacterium]|nr:hypothetical protein [Lujinxingiaceae bacterium]